MSDAMSRSIAEQIEGRSSSCPNCAALRGEVADLKQQVANMEEYVNKGVEFRDELQADLANVRRRNAHLHEDVEKLQAALSRYRDAAEVAKLLDEEQRGFQRWTLDMPKDVYDALTAYRRANSRRAGEGAT